MHALRDQLAALKKKLGPRYLHVLNVKVPNGSLQERRERPYSTPTAFCRARRYRTRRGPPVDLALGVEKAVGVASESAWLIPCMVLVINDNLYGLMFCIKLYL